MEEFQGLNNESFSKSLKKARESCGFDVETLARRLHIRWDILEAIESADFDRMPASGYTRNMVRAYARTVGLNQNEICERYFQELETYSNSNSYDDGFALNSRRSNKRIHQDKNEEISSYNTNTSGSRRTSSRVSFLDLAGGDFDGVYSGRNLEDRLNANEQPNVKEKLESKERQQNKVARKRLEKSRKEGFRRNQDRHFKGSVPELSKIPRPNLNINPKSLDLKKIIIVIVCLAIVIALFFFISGAINSNKQPNDDIPAMPISGLTDTTTDSTS